MPATTSSPINPGDRQHADAARLSPAVCRGLLDWFARVPDHRSRRGLRHQLTVVLALAACAVVAAGNDGLVAIAQWTAAAPQDVLADLGARYDPFTGVYTAPSERTTRRVLAGMDTDALDDAVAGYLAQVAREAITPDPGIAPDPAEREQRRAANTDRNPAHVRARYRAIALDGKCLRGARRARGRVHLLAAICHRSGAVLAQREIAAKTGEIGAVKPLLAGLDLTDAVITADALHSQRETARHLCHDRGAHYVLILKANQPSLLAAAITALTGSAADFADTSATQDDRGHGRRERRTIRTAPAAGIDFPHAAQVFQIRRDVGELDEPCWRTKEIIYGITDLTPRQAGPTEIAAHAREHWTVENRLHWVRDVTFGEDASQVRTGNTPRAMAALRNLAISALRLAGHANIAHARRSTRNHRQALAVFKL